MGLFHKKPDPIVQRERDLNSEIAKLEAEIRKLNKQCADTNRIPRVRSSTPPPGVTPAAPAPVATPTEPVFEPVNQVPLKADSETPTPAHFNELGVRKFDLAGTWKKMTNHVQGQPGDNPRLITLLAAGGIRGLRPLRYEKRVARNRFLFLFVIFFLLLWGIIAVFIRSH